MIFNWRHYLRDQLVWAECLFSRAEECNDEERQKLYELGKSALHNAAQRMDEIYKYQG
jgi:hypothetical protein